MLPLVSQAWRSWKSAKGVALLVVVAFTVGIGSATAIYTVINTLLLKPVPYAHGERFVSVLGAQTDEPARMASLSMADVLEYQQRTRSFDLFGWIKPTNYNLTAPGQPLHLIGVEVTAALANGLGVNPRAGQWFRDPVTAPVAVISNELWLRLGADPGFVGKTITLGGRIYTVTGVMPPGFHLPYWAPYGDPHVDVWVPLDPLGRGYGPGDGPFFGYARLRPGVTRAEAEAEVKRVAADIAKRDPGSRQLYTARVDGLRELATRDIKPVLLLLFAAAELLLLITCANVGGLLLAHSVARARETAVRVALGARLRQLGLQYFLESLFISLAGAAGGLLFSGLVVRLLVSLIGQPGTPLDEISMDWKVVLFALATAFLASLLTSLVPLRQAARTQPNDVLNEGVRASAGARSRRLSQSFVVAEIALAFVLLAGGAILVSELYRLLRIWPGFDPHNLLTFQITFAPEEIPGKPSQATYQNRLLEALAAIPGVAGAGIVNQSPLDCCLSTAIYPEGPLARPSRGETVKHLPVSLGYVKALGLTLRRGRFLDRRDDTAVKFVPAAINQAAVTRYWPNQDPIGAFGRFNHPSGDRFQVVGVVGDTRNNGLDSPPVPEIYLSSAIAPPNPIFFLVRAPVPIGTLVPAVRRAIQAVNPGQPIHEVKTMDEIVRDSLWLKRVASYLVTFFALAALLLATFGAYGVVSYSVRQRTVEIGTRMAMGAGSRDLLALVVGSGLKMAAYGAGVGGVASIGAAWLLVRQVGVQHLGWLPFALSAATVAAVAATASFLPAWRATLLSPMVAIRNEPGSMWESARRGVGRFFEKLAIPAGAPIRPDGALVAGFIEASRRAASFREALRDALESLRLNAGADSAHLLERAPGGEYRSEAVSLPARGLLLNRLQRYSAPLPIPSDDLDTWRRWAAEFKPGSLTEIETLRASGASLAIALRTGQGIAGVILLGGRVFSPSEKTLLGGCADQFALMLENARLTDRVLEQEKLQRDIDLAAEVQKRLLPRQSLETGAAALAAVNLPARTVGGDYYDFLELDEHRTGIALADVAGKGVAAALLMSVVQASLRVLSSDAAISLPELASKMNHFLYRSTGAASYATFFYACLDQRSRLLRYVNAGHNPPYLLRADGASLAVDELSTGGTIIGMFPRAPFQEGSINLRPGDVLAAFTDGVTEAVNPAGEEFGGERLKDLLRRTAHLPVDQILSRLSRELEDWMLDAPRHDDLTFVLMKVK